MIVEEFKGIRKAPVEEPRIEVEKALFPDYVVPGKYYGTIRYFLIVPEDAEIEWRFLVATPDFMKCVIRVRGRFGEKYFFAKNGFYSGGFIRPATREEWEAAAQRC